MEKNSEKKIILVFFQKILPIKWPSELKCSVGEA